ncbi:MAG: hypothetical protein KJO38_12230 [Gammaproteobacteria bacterium]|nr:hypothetical protein [Gammaproteobacteria bacterium]
MRNYRLPLNAALSAVCLSAVFTFTPVSDADAAGVTGLEFVGGCSTDGTGLCSGSDPNADDDNVAAILGVDASLVTQASTGFSVSGIGSTDGTWTVTDPEVTHLAFKSAGYFILGAVQAGSGTWDNIITIPAGAGWDISIPCPDALCDGTPRNYQISDFQTGGGNFADLSNVRGFTVVPVPGALPLLASALAAFGLMRRRSEA